jgi:hypothetical protein
MNTGERRLSPSPSFLSFPSFSPLISQHSYLSRPLLPLIAHATQRQLADFFSILLISAS